MRLICTVLVFLATPAVATEHNTPVEYDLECNAHGAKLTFPEGTTVYLGKSCDAAIPGQGEGRWWYAASAFLFEVGSIYRRIPGDLNCPAMPYCTYE